MDGQLLAAQLTVSSFSLASVWRAGDRHVSAWYLLIVGHAVFLCYSALTAQWGFWPLNAGMIAFGVRNLRKDLRRKNVEHARQSGPSS